jgi:hypothetical protein
MTTFLTILLILAMLGALGALIRGVINFLRAGHQDVHGGAGPSEFSLKQNRMMQARIMFQALAVIVAVLLILLARG